MPLDHGSIKNFLQTYKLELHWLARCITPEDIEQTVWTFALELQRERDSPVELCNSVDGTEVLRRIKRAHGRQRRGNVSGISLDQPRISRDAEQMTSLLESIRAIGGSDPLEALLHEEEHAEQCSKLIRLCTESFSQFSAYVVLLLKFDCIKEDAAAYLAITAATLDRRIRRAIAWRAAQPSLFDRIVSLSLDKLPPQRFSWPKARRPPLQMAQPFLELPHILPVAGIPAT
jgi:hypothetical protein